MITFILLEDGKVLSKKLSNLINSFMMRNKINYEIKVFNKVDDKLDSVIKDNNRNKIYLINTNVSNDLASEIRINDWNSIIILLKDDINSYARTKRLQVLDTIILDDEIENKLNELFPICLRQLDIKKSIHIKRRGYEYRFSPNEILYVFKDKNRKTIIVTDTNKYETNIKLKEVSNEIGDFMVQIHKSCFININRIVKIDYSTDTITFDNNHKCKMLSTYYKNKLKK